MRLPSFCCFTAACLLFACTLFVSPVPALAASFRDCDALLSKQVMVTLTDGRTPRGVLSPKSSDDSLVLTISVPGIVIESRFAWGLVQAVDLLSFTNTKPLPRPADPVPDDEATTSEPAKDRCSNNCRGRRCQRRFGCWQHPPRCDSYCCADPDNNAPTHIEAPAGRVLDNAVPPTPMLPEARLLHETLAPSTTDMLSFSASEIATVDVLPELVPPDHRRAVRSLNIRATVANWDRDAEVDGLLLHVQPLDGFGTLVPVDGVIDVQLATETKFASGGRSNVRDDNTFSVPERWSVPIRAIDFDATGTTVKLPFRRFHPERQFDIASSALAMAKLKLPTAGVFEASDPFVQLRPYSPFRDELQEWRGQRLFPGEATPRW